MEDRGKCACGEDAVFVVFITDFNGDVLGENSFCEECIDMREVKRAVLALGILLGART